MMDATYVSRSTCLGHVQQGFGVETAGSRVPNCDSDGDADSNAGLLEAGEASGNNSAYIRRPGHFSMSINGKADSSLYFADKRGGRDGHAGVAAVFEQVRQATRVWVTVAACLLLLFIAVSSILSWRSTKPSLAVPRTGQGVTLIRQETTKDVHAALHAAIGPRNHIHQEEPRYSKHERSDFSEDGTKQHPDDLSYVDVWDGEEHHDLHLSRGVEGLQTPLYRLPFVDGQYNETHVVGVHTSPLNVPRRLWVDGGRIEEAIGGTYDIMVTRDGRPKPLLIHGRLVWKRITNAQHSAETNVMASPLYLFYDHTHHTWVFNRELNFRKPDPLAFLPHGALLPVIRQKVRPHVTTDPNTDMENSKRYTEYAQHGVPKSVHWVVRDSGPVNTVSGATSRSASVGVTADPSIRVTGHPSFVGPEDFCQLSVQKVFHAPEEGSLDLSDVDDPEEDENLHDDDAEQQSDEHYEDEDEGELEKLFIPEQARTRQQFLTHPQTHVYHTFDEMHKSYDHRNIVADPVAYLETHGHPDVEGVERQFGDDTPGERHPLRPED
ncbi:transmembrane protein [Cystoisospora suis]|uniref:Transmembrane protein n=1 Tax=Cystoisospora suis TaxID=483139 RepID=A0A2C6LAC2_9APIC|nr:transmembrane protein [Cystoisospora suis]